MNMFKALLLVIACLGLSTESMAAVQRFAHDIKLPSQVIMERQTVTTPVVATTNAVLTTNAGPTSAAALTISTGLSNPDVPRNLTITPTGTTTDVESCVITVTGTNIFGQTITEDFTFAADASTAQTGNKAFKTVTSVAFPASCESGGFAATWIVGVGSKLGLKRCLANAGDMVFSIFNGAYEATRGTTAANATAIESNTFIPNGTMDGAKDVIVNFVQNYRCSP
jgi:hypothetical protein